MTNDCQVVLKNSRARPRVALCLVVGLTMVAASSSLGCKKSSAAPDDSGRGSHTPPIKAVLHLDSFVVNLADTEENRFLRVGIDLGLGVPVSGKEGEGGVPTARVRDCILTVLSTWRSDALLAPEGKQKLKDELLHALQDRVPELGVKEIYLTEFLVQR